MYTYEGRVGDMQVFGREFHEILIWMHCYRIRVKFVVVCECVSEWVERVHVWVFSIMSDFMYNNNKSN